MALPTFRPQDAPTKKLYHKESLKIHVPVRPVTIMLPGLKVPSFVPASAGFQVPAGLTLTFSDWLLNRLKTSIQKPSQLLE